MLNEHKGQGELIVCQMEDEKQRIASETFATFAFYSTKT
jgi:hypothetical protein